MHGRVCGAARVIRGECCRGQTIVNLESVPSSTDGRKKEENKILFFVHDPTRFRCAAKVPAHAPNSDSSVRRGVRARFSVVLVRRSPLIQVQFTRIHFQRRSHGTAQANSAGRENQATDARQCE